MGKGGIIFVVLPGVFVQENKTHIRRRKTQPSTAEQHCQDAASSPGVHTMHTAARGVVELMLRVTPGLSKVLSSPLPAQD